MRREKKHFFAFSFFYLTAMNRQHICFVFVLYVSSIFFSIKLCVFNDLDFFDRYAYAVCVLPDDLSFFPFVRSAKNVRK